MEFLNDEQFDQIIIGEIWVIFISIIYLSHIIWWCCLYYPILIMWRGVSQTCNLKQKQTMLSVISRLGLIAGKVKRMVKPEYVWPDHLDQDGYTTFLSPDTRTWIVFLPDVQFDIQGSHNGYLPLPVIDNISLQQWYHDYYWGILVYLYKALHI